MSSETGQPGDRPEASRAWRWLRWPVILCSGFIFFWSAALYANALKIDPPPAVGVACAALGYLLCVVVHELGHAVAALLVRWRLIVFAVRPWAWHFVHRELVPVRNSSDQVVRGYVFAVPSGPRAATGGRWAIVLVGGAVANILVGVVAFGLAGAWHDGMDRPGPLPDMLAFAIGLQSLHVGLGALLPDVWGRRRSDGWRLLALWRAPERWNATKAFAWMISLGAYNVRLADYPQWLVDAVDAEAERGDTPAREVAAAKIGRVLDSLPVDTARARAMLEAFRADHGVTEWHSYCDVYLATVWENEGPAAEARLWQGERHPYFVPLRAAVEAGIEARRGDAGAAREKLARMEAALRARSPFRDATFRDIRARIEALLVSAP